MSQVAKLAFEFVREGEAGKLNVQARQRGGDLFSTASNAGD
jgi:hypothetical protein